MRAPVGLKDPDFLGKMCFGVAAGKSEDIVREVSGYLMAEQKDRDSREKELEKINSLTGIGCCRCLLSHQLLLQQLDAGGPSVYLFGGLPVV